DGARRARRRASQAAAPVSIRSRRPARFRPPVAELDPARGSRRRLRARDPRRILPRRVQRRGAGSGYERRVDADRVARPAAARAFLHSGTALAPRPGRDGGSAVTGGHPRRTLASHEARLAVSPDAVRSGARRGVAMTQSLDARVDAATTASRGPERTG